MDSHAPMPPTTSGSCATRRCAAFFAFSAESPASIATSSSLAPPSALMPPAALISSTAVSAPIFTSVPCRAQGPDSGTMTAILTFFGCACTATGVDQICSEHNGCRREQRRRAGSAIAISCASSVYRCSSFLLALGCVSAPHSPDSHAEIGAPHALIRHQRLVRCLPSRRGRFPARSRGRRSQAPRRRAARPAGW